MLFKKGILKVYNENEFQIRNLEYLKYVFESGIVSINKEIDVSYKIFVKNCSNIPNVPIQEISPSYTDEKRTVFPDYTEKEIQLRKNNNESLLSIDSLLFIQHKFNNIFSLFNEQTINEHVSNDFVLINKLITTDSINNSFDTKGWVEKEAGVGFFVTYKSYKALKTFISYKKNSSLSKSYDCYHSIYTFLEAPKFNKMGKIQTELNKEKNFNASRIVNTIRQSKNGITFLSSPTGNCIGNDILEKIIQNSMKENLASNILIILNGRKKTLTLFNSLKNNTKQRVYCVIKEYYYKMLDSFTKQKITFFSFSNNIINNKFLKNYIEENTYKKIEKLNEKQNRIISIYDKKYKIDIKNDDELLNSMESDNYSEFFKLIQEKKNNEISQSVIKQLSNDLYFIEEIEIIRKEIRKTLSSLTFFDPDNDGKTALETKEQIHIASENDILDYPNYFDFFQLIFFDDAGEYDLSELSQLLQNHDNKKFCLIFDPLSLPRKYYTQKNLNRNNLIKETLTTLMYDLDIKRNDNKSLACNPNDKVYILPYVLREENEIESIIYSIVYENYNKVTYSKKENNEDRRVFLVNTHMNGKDSAKRIRRGFVSELNVQIEEKLVKIIKQKNKKATIVICCLFSEQQKLVENNLGKNQGIHVMNIASNNGKIPRTKDLYLIFDLSVKSNEDKTYSNSGVFQDPKQQKMISYLGKMRTADKSVYFITDYYYFIDCFLKESGNTLSFEMMILDKVAERCLINVEELLDVDKNQIISDN